MLWQQSVGRRDLSHVKLWPINQHLLPQSFPLFICPRQAGDFEVLEGSRAQRKAPGSLNGFLFIENPT